MNYENVMKLALERAFYFPSCEVYGDAQAGFWEYGPTGVSVKNKLVVVGNPVEEIINNGLDYSFIVLADTGKTGLKRFFMGSVAFKVMEYANNSVMILR